MPTQWHCRCVARQKQMRDAKHAGGRKYAAPEQIECGEITVATDIYALSAVLYELLAGRGPWQLGGDAPLPTVLRRMLYEAPAERGGYETGSRCASHPMSTQS